MSSKKNNAKKKSNNRTKLSSTLLRVFFIIVVIGLIVLEVYSTHIMSKNADILFYDKVTKHVSEVYSMKVETDDSGREVSDFYQKDRVNYLKKNQIDTLVAYTSAIRILVTTTDNLPYSELKRVSESEIIPLQDTRFRNAKPEFIVRSKIDFNRELDGSYYYVRLVDKEYADRLFFLKQARDIAIVVTTLLMFLCLYFYDKFSQLHDSLKQKNDLVSLGSATRRLAHEIKNPVAAIMMQVSLLERMHPDQAEEYAIIKTEGKRIVSLTDRIREFMADPLGSIEMINFLDFMREEVGYFKPGIITANYYISDEASYVYFDKTRLRSIIINIIQNAIDSQVEKDTCKVVVNVSSVQNNSKIKIEIMDWGTGIKDSDKNKLFNPFFTTKNVGTGIGLSISKQFLNARNSSIDLSNRLSANGKVEGATCTIILDKGKPS